MGKSGEDPGVSGLQVDTIRWVEREGQQRCRARDTIALFQQYET